ncbi:MAG TPA: YfhO family protein, partial [Patescibacteria group bacterium]|nr:YfhO family protein [Patescibacteria group bacterium]
LIVVWATSLLAARGYDALGARGDARRRWGRMLGWLLLPAFVLLLADNWLGICGSLITGALGLPASLAGGATLETINGAVRHASIDAAFLGLMVWVVMFGTFGRLSRLVVFFVTLGPLLFAGVRLNPVAPASFYSEPPALGRLIDQAGGTGRLWATPRPKGFAYRTPAGHEADSLEGGFRWDRMTLRNATYFPSGYRFAFDRGNERLDVIPGATIGKALSESEKNPIRPEAMSRLLCLAGVDRIITYGGLDAPGLSEAGRLEGQSNISVVVMKNGAALPRARIAHQHEVIFSMGAALRRLDDPSFDPARSVILEEAPVAPVQPGAHPPGAVPGGAGDQAAGSSTARIVTDHPSRVVVSTNTGTAGFLVLSDTFYPGWKAKVDGSDTLIIRADAMFRAVPVPAGGHEVEFVYKPSSVRSGLMVTAAALLLCALLAVPRRR